MKLTQSQLEKLYEARNNKAQDYFDQLGSSSITYHAFQHGFDACLREIEKLNESTMCEHSGIEFKGQSVTWDLQTK